MNKTRLRCFKDEVNGKIISEFVGLKPKMYAMRLDDGGQENGKRYSKTNR